VLHIREIRVVRSHDLRKVTSGETIVLPDNKLLDAHNKYAPEMSGVQPRAVKLEA